MKRKCEKLRNEWHPKKKGKEVRILFVGESAPLGSDYHFYDVHSRMHRMRLSSILTRAFDFEGNKEKRLEQFQSDGYWLTDLFDFEDGGNLSLGKKLERLSVEIKESKPKVIVTIFPERKFPYGLLKEVFFNLFAEKYRIRQDIRHASSPWSKTNEFFEFVDNLIDEFNLTRSS
ncbi:MAG: hypothetical protein ACW99U_15705 [Candidatus Thorarchaeota archaeon]|jgi:hypothetical protein